MKIRRLEAAIEPYLTGLCKQSQLLIGFGELFVLLLLLLFGDEDDTLELVDEVVLDVDLVGDESDRRVVNVVRVIIVEKQQQ